MDVARRLEALGSPEGTTVVAASQSRGRGRSNRSWQSPSGAGLYCSILLRPNLPPDQFQPFSIAVGLAICSALDPGWEIGLQLKWPNDILFQDRKLAGVLVSAGVDGSRIASAIVGLGINIRTDPSRPETAIAMSEIPRCRLHSADETLLAIVPGISYRYSALLKGEWQVSLEGWQTRLAYLGREVALEDGHRQAIGTLAGIDSLGALILDTPAGVQRYVSGELVRGPRPV